MDLGGTPEDYDIGDEKVFRKTDPSKSITYAKAAQRAIELGGKFGGQEVPEDINPITKGAVAHASPGTGLIGVAKDKLPHDGHGAGARRRRFVEIELDVETGQVQDPRTCSASPTAAPSSIRRASPRRSRAARHGHRPGALERHVYDPQNGLPANVGLYQAKPPTYLDVPAEMHAADVDKPDPQSPVGAKGIGEPPLGSAAAALALRDLGRARRALLQPHAGVARHDRQRAGGAAAGAQAAAGQHGLRERRHDRQGHDARASSCSSRRSSTTLSPCSTATARTAGRLAGGNDSLTGSRTAPSGRRSVDRPRRHRRAQGHPRDRRRDRDRRADHAHRDRAQPDHPREVRGAGGRRRAGGEPADPQHRHASAATSRRTRAAGTTATACRATGPAATPATPTRRRA